MRSLAAALALIFLASGQASAHALDEYLQAAQFTVQRDRIELSLRLVPGVSILPALIGSLDSNHDGVISEAEGRQYLERLIGDLRLSVDGELLSMKLIKLELPQLEQVKEGQGEIHAWLEARIPVKSGPRKLLFENQHRPQISAYLVNAMVPDDPGIELGKQTRSEDQSRYQLDYRVK